MDQNSKIRILVVDKDYNKREYVRSALDQIGVDCTTHETNNESITSFRHGIYDGVILDCDDEAFSSFIAAAKACNKQDVPIILYSGSTRMARYKHLWDNGFFVIQPNAQLPSTLQSFVDIIVSRKTKDTQERLPNVRYSHA